MKTEVILTTNIVGLGGESDQVKVAPGYARNYLYPQRLAVPVTQANKRQLEVLRRRRAEREAHEFNTMSELAKSLTKLVCVIKVKAGDDGKMFGAVTSGMIADELKHQFDVSLEKRKIHVDQPIKMLGEYEVQLSLHAEVKSALKVRVESTTPPSATETGPTEARAEGPRTEKRGRRPEKVETVEEKPKAAAKPERTVKPERKPKKAD